MVNIFSRTNTTEKFRKTYYEYRLRVLIERYTMKGNTEWHSNNMGILKNFLQQIGSKSSQP